jgi:hypothetical protein
VPAWRSLKPEASSRHACAYACSAADYFRPVSRVRKLILHNPARVLAAVTQPGELAKDEPVRRAALDRRVLANAPKKAPSLIHIKHRGPDRGIR